MSVIPTAGKSSIPFKFTSALSVLQFQGKCEVVGLPKPFVRRALRFSAKAFIPVEKLTEKLDNMVGTGLLESPKKCIYISQVVL